jgi:hypothetical protein
MILRATNRDHQLALDGTSLNALCPNANRRQLDVLLVGNIDPIVAAYKTWSHSYPTSKRSRPICLG